MDEFRVIGVGECRFTIPHFAEGVSEDHSEIEFLSRQTIRQLEGLDGILMLVDAVSDLITRYLILTEKGFHPPFKGLGINLE